MSNGNAPRGGATKRKGTTMFVTIDRAAIESAIYQEYSLINRDQWFAAECRYGVLAVCEYEESAQEVIMDYAQRNAEDDGDVECVLAECAIRPATDQEVVDALIDRELGQIAWKSLYAQTAEDFRDSFINGLVELGYPEDEFIRFDKNPRKYYDGSMRYYVDYEY